ncbi:MAG: hypothetical protein ACLFV5_02090 [Anaerolineales bacterium]
MDRRKRIVIYGSSLHMAGIAASLTADPGLEVVCINPHDPDASHRLKERDPAVIIFDTGDTDSELDINLLRDQPGTLLIGLDVSSDELLILSSHPKQAHSVSALVDIIRGQGYNREKVT